MVENQACTSPPLVPRVTARILGVLLIHRNHALRLGLAFRLVNDGPAISKCRPRHASAHKSFPPVLWRNSAEFRYAANRYSHRTFLSETAFDVAGAFQKLVRIQSIPDNPVRRRRQIDGKSLRL